MDWLWIVCLDMLCVQVSYSECGHESVTSEPFWDLSLEFPPQSVDPVLMINNLLVTVCCTIRLRYQECAKRHQEERTCSLYG